MRSNGMTSHGTVNICFGEDYHEIMVRRLLIPTHAFWTSFTGIIDHFLIHKSHWITYGHMMTSLNANIFRVTGPLWGEFTGHRWIPLTKASDSDFWRFIWSAPWINNWINNREADDLRRHRAHFDVNIMNIPQTDLEYWQHFKSVWGI